MAGVSHKPRQQDSLFSTIIRRRHFIVTPSSQVLGWQHSPAGIILCDMTIDAARHG